MSPSLYEMIITELYAFNRIHVPRGQVSARRDRERSALAIKTAGSTVYTMDKAATVSDSGHVVFLPKGASYTWQCLEEGECLMIEMDCAHAPEAICRAPVKNMQEVASIFSRLEHLTVFRQRGYTPKCMAGVYEILSRLADSEQTDYKLSSKREKIRPAVEYIENHYEDREIGNEMLAHLSGISTVYFRKIFTEIYGVSPMQYVSAVKIEKAKGLLLSDYGTVEQVSEAAGFGSVYHFSKAFKQATGLPPGQYAKLKRTR